jgi:hypothetical protein
MAASSHDSSTESGFVDYDTLTLDMMALIIRGNRDFYDTIPHLREGRPQLMALHQRNNATMLEIIRSQTTARSRNVVTVTLSGGEGANWLESAVPITPSPAQVASGTSRNLVMTEATVCSICQDMVTSATRLSNCGHCFHAACIDEWFTQSPRCPMCRNDIRERPQQ